jgi:hypothetical protein
MKSSHCFIGEILLPKQASVYSGLFSVAWESNEISHSSLSEEKEDYSADSIT